MCLVHDPQVCGNRVRTLNAFDEGVRKVLVIGVDGWLLTERVIRVLAQLKERASQLWVRAW